MKFENPFKMLTKFEWCLWGFSMAVTAVSFFLSGSGGMLALTASLIGVTALIFVAKGMVMGQALTVLFSVFYGIVSYKTRYYGEMLTYLGMTAPIALASVISWVRHPYGDTKQVETAKVTPKTAAILFAAGAAVTVIFYFLLKAVGNASLFFSTLSVFTSFIASGLTFLRSPWYAVGYSANDIVLIVLWSIASLKEPSDTPMIFCFVMFLANDIYGFISWRRLAHAQSRNDENNSH